MAEAYGVNVWDDAGRLSVGFDNPTCIIDSVTRQDGVVSYDPPIVNGFTVTFSDSLSKSYAQRSGVSRLVCVGMYNAISQTNSLPYCVGWTVLEVG